jgi:predicted tellurium resistance membrane protein TerC
VAFLHHFGQARGGKLESEMADIINLENLFTLAMLILLQAVLGFDNLLYISIESKRVAPQYQAMVRRVGIGLAIVLRIVLLFVVVEAIDAFGEPFASLHIAGIVEAGFSIHSLIVLLGGGFIIYTALKEIYHMLSVENLEDHSGSGGRSVAGAIVWIVAMNLVFSFDSILSALALTDVFWVMAAAIVISGILMIVMADQVSVFLQKNRMYEVLGLFVLLIVGVMLVSEGGHLAHLMFFSFPVEPMAKTTFYFVLAVLVIVEIVQSRYQRKIMAQKHAEIEAGGKVVA